MYIILEILWLLLCIIYSYIHALARIIIPKSPKSVKDKVALITGGAKGIGREIALRLAEKGAKLVILDVDADSCKQTADDIRGLGADVQTYICDVRNREDVGKTAASIRREVGNVDMLFNNAGIAIVKRILDLSEEEIRRTLDVNLTSHFWTLQEFLPSMMARNSGHVITICSYAGAIGSELLTDYAATKFAVRGLTESVEKEMISQEVTDINFTTVYPNFTNTNLVRDVSHRVGVCDRFGYILEPAYVGEVIVDGVLRDKRHIYIPGHGCLIDMMQCLIPRKGKRAISKFLNTRFAIKE